MAKILDKIDKKILKHIQGDATLSMDALAELAGLSRNACWRRVKQLEQSGVILGRYTLLNAESVDRGLSVFVLIKVAEHNPVWLSQFESAVKDNVEILGAHRMTGELDYVLRVRVKDVAGYDQFYQNFIAQVPLADVSASFVMQDIKDSTLLPV